MHDDAISHRQHAIRSSPLGLQFFYECYILDALTVDELTVDELTVDKLTVQQSCSVVETGRMAFILPSKDPVFAPL